MAGRILLDDPARVGGSSQLLIGSAANDHTGDQPRDGGQKLKLWASDVNTMSAEIFAGLGAVPAWVKVGSALGYATFSAAALSNNVNLFQLAPSQIIHAIKIKHSQAFAGGSISGYTVSVGVSGDVARYASAFNVFQAPGARIYELSMNLAGEDATANTQITATAVSVGANLNAATAGAVDIWALLSVAA